MRNLSRILALNAALILAGLTIPVSATSMGTCLVKCVDPRAGTYTDVTTAGDCCSGNITNHCPSGSTPVPISWNYIHCV
jgi:hypothetical protein